MCISEKQWIVSISHSFSDPLSVSLAPCKNIKPLASMYGTGYTVTRRLWSWSYTLVTSLHLLHNSLFSPSFCRSLCLQRLDFSPIMPSSLLLFHLSHSPSLSLTCALSPQCWVIKVVRAIPLPGGVEDLFKGCQDQNENQLVLGFCPFITQAEAASSLVGLCLVLNTGSG